MSQNLSVLVECPSISYSSKAVLFFLIFIPIPTTAASIIPLSKLATPSASTPQTFFPPRKISLIGTDDKEVAEVIGYDELYHDKYGEVVYFKQVNADDKDLVLLGEDRQVTYL